MAAFVLPIQPLFAIEEKVPASETLMRALVDELQRSMNLQMEDLEKPYFIQYRVGDALMYNLSADYGALVTVDRDRGRRLRTRVRVGSYELDNTNFADQGGFFFGGGGGAGGAQASLPLDDDYLAIRQAIWEATDRDYKSAVETLTKKRAYMKDKTFEDRPNDFSKAEPTEIAEPGAVLDLDLQAWEQRLKAITAHLKKFPEIQDSGVRMLVGAGNDYVVNSEGTRVRTSSTIVLFFITAEVQAADGMRISHGRSYSAEVPGELPSLEEMLKDTDELVAQLTTIMKAEPVEHYSGPVMFDEVAAGQLFRAMLAEGVAGEPDIVGEQRRSAGSENLEKKLGTRILPRSFKVWDDPTAKKHGDDILIGHYLFDDEGVPAQSVDIVDKGRLVDMCMSRVPTKKKSGSNGHGRSPAGGGDPEAAISCLFIEDEDGMPADDLKSELIDAARDEGLEYGIRVASIRSAGISSSRSDFLALFQRAQSGGSVLGDPILAYKVYVEDGREEPIRGCEFGQVDVVALKHILAAGDTPTVYNYLGVGFGGSTPASSIIAPPVILEEVELTKIEAEHDTQPILAAPNFRE